MDVRSRQSGLAQRQMNGRRRFHRHTNLPQAASAQAEFAMFPKRRQTSFPSFPELAVYLRR